MPLVRALRRLPTIEPLPWVAVLGYFVVYLLLDWASFIRPLQNLNITPWNPPPALAVALLLANRRLWWVVWLSLMAGEVLLRGQSGTVVVSAVACAGLTANYLAMAEALSRTLREGWRLDSRRDVAWLGAVVGLGSLLSASLYVGSYALAGVLPWLPPWQALARYWVGDTVGLVVTLPLVLALADAQRRAVLVQTLRHPQAWLIGLAACATLWLLFGPLDPQQGRGHGYLLLLPVIWAATRFGSAGGLLASALTQVGLIVWLQFAHPQDLAVVEMQLRMTVITMTGLLLGVVVDERARADAELRRSLHLVAAGRMSAALAHELSQPLTALTTYAQACEMLARPDPSIDEARRRRQLVHVAARISADAIRAGEVVRRLRDFFRSGSTQLQSTDIGLLAREALDAQSPRAQAAGIALELEWPPGLPAAWVDPVQIAVVLRNLVANALDAMTPGGSPGRVRLLGSRHDGMLRVEVIDGGRGVSAARAAALFDGQSAGPGSDKVGGMGVGLGICRAIVEAHGGRLWCEPAPYGHFCFTLPLDVPVPETPHPTDEHHVQ